jgi:hypothetical protein
MSLNQKRLLYYGLSIIKEYQLHNAVYSAKLTFVTKDQQNQPTLIF